MTKNPPIICLVCGHESKSVMAYLGHMAKEHPEIQVAGGRR
jgi:hypothetical protein